MKLLIDAHKFGEKHEGTSTYLAGMYHALMVLHPEWEYVFVGTHQNAMQTVFGQRPNVQYRLLKSHNRFWRMLVEMPRICAKNDQILPTFNTSHPCGRQHPVL